jgi:Domain of unknown function (DUF397)
MIKWVKAEACGSGGCVELGVHADGEVWVRSSKNPYGPVLHFTQGELAAFLDGAKAGEFDHLLTKVTA